MANWDDFSTVVPEAPKASTASSGSAWDAFSAPAVADFDRALADEGIDPKSPAGALARSIYSQESNAGKNPNTSVKGAMGGMQVMPKTFGEVAEKDWKIDDPQRNLQAGIRYAKKMYDSTGDIRLAAIGYYGGPDGITAARNGKAFGVTDHPSHPNTFQYGDQVAQRAQQYLSEAPQGSQGPQQAPQGTTPPPQAIVPPPGSVPTTPVPVTPQPGLIDQGIAKVKEEGSQLVNEFKQDPMKALGNVWSGIKQGVYSDNVLGIQQLTGRAAQVATSGDTNANMKRKTDAVDAEVTANEKAYQEKTGDSNASGVGRVVGNVLTPLGALSAIKKAYSVGGKFVQGAKAGAVGGAVQSVDTSKGDYTTQKATQVAIGAGAGGVLGAGARAVQEGAAKLGFKPAENSLIKETMQRQFTGETAKIDAEIVRDLGVLKASKGGSLTASDSTDLSKAYVDNLKLQIKGAGLNDQASREVLANIKTPHLISAETKVAMQSTPEGQAILENVSKARRVSQLVPDQDPSAIGALIKNGATLATDVGMSAMMGMPAPLVTGIRLATRKLGSKGSTRFSKAEEAVSGRNVKAAERFLAENGESAASKGMSDLRQAVVGRNERITEDTRKRAEEAIARREAKEDLKADQKDFKLARQDEARVESARREIDSVIARETKRRAEQAKLKAKEEADRLEVQEKRKNLSGTGLQKTIDKARNDTDKEVQEALTTQVSGGIPDLFSNLPRKAEAADPIKAVLRAESDQTAQALKQLEGKVPSVGPKPPKTSSEAPKGPQDAPQAVVKTNPVVTPKVEIKALSEAPKAPAVDSPIQEVLKRGRGRPADAPEVRAAKEQAKADKEAAVTKRDSVDVSESANGGAKIYFKSEYSYDDDKLDSLAREYFKDKGVDQVRDGFLAGKNIGRAHFKGLQKHLDAAFEKDTGVKIRRDSRGRLIRSEEKYDGGTSRRGEEYDRANKEVNNQLKWPLELRRKVNEGIRKLREGPGPDDGANLMKRQMVVSDLYREFPEHRDELEKILSNLVDFAKL